MMYIYTMEYYSAIKKNKILPFVATWMDLESILLSEVSQTEKDKYLWYKLYVESKKKMIKMNLYELKYKKEINSEAQKTNLWLPKRKRGGGIN